MKRLGTAILLLAIFFATVAADEPAGSKKKGSSSASVLDDLIRKQKERQAREKQPGRAKLRPGTTKARTEHDAPLSPAPNRELDQVLDRMEKVRTKIVTLECELTKWKLVPLFEIDQEFRGTLKFRTPRLLRMELKGPVPGKDKKSAVQRATVTIVNKEFAYIWRLADKEAERFKLPAMDDKKFSERNPLEYGLAADIRNLKRDYYLNLRGKEKIDGRITYKIVAGPKPHLKDARYKRLYFWVDAISLVPVRFRQVKSDGEVIETYGLKKLKMNVSWKKNPFKRPPRGVHIIAHDLAEPRR